LRLVDLDQANHCGCSEPPCEPTHRTYLWQHRGAIGDHTRDAHRSAQARRRSTSADERDATCCVETTARMVLTTRARRASTTCNVGAACALARAHPRDGATTGTTTRKPLAAKPPGVRPSRAAFSAATVTPTHIQPGRRTLCAGRPSGRSGGAHRRRRRTVGREEKRRLRRRSRP